MAAEDFYGYRYNNDPGAARMLHQEVAAAAAEPPTAKLVEAKILRVGCREVTFQKKDNRITVSDNGGSVDLNRGQFIETIRALTEWLAR